MKTLNLQRTTLILLLNIILNDAYCGCSQIKGGTVFLTHGAGPYPLLQPSLHKQMYLKIQQISTKYPSPKGIIFVSAHWQQNQWTLLDYDNPPLYYDYYGFPTQSYNLSYSITSSSQFRQIIKQQLASNGIHIKSNYQRGYDHGVFIPLMIIYEQNKTPEVVEISIKSNLDPSEHYNFGKALRNLKKKGYLIIGSGASSHGGFGRIQSQKKSKQFNIQLTKLVMEQYNENKIIKGIKEWKKLKHSQQMHPREQHLVPLFVVLGAYQGKQKQQQTYYDNLMKLHLRNYILI